MKQTPILKMWMHQWRPLKIYKEVKENIVPNADWTIGALIDKMAKNNSRMAGKRITEKAEWL